MKESWLTLQERQLKALMQLWGALFAFAGIVFAGFASETVYWLNAAGRAIFGWSHPPLSLPSENFWQVLAVSMMAVITVAAIKAARDIRQNIDYVKLIIISKFVSSLGFAVCFFTDGAFFAYLAGFVIDFSIFILTLWCYKRATNSRVI